MDCSMPGLPVHHQLPELAQTHVHWAGDAIQPSHPLLSPSPAVFNLSQHQGLFQWVSSVHQVAQVLKFQFQHRSFKFPLRLTGWISCSPRESQESSPKKKKKKESSPIPQFKSINSSVLSFLHSPTLTSIHNYWKNHSLDWTDLCWQSNVGF